MKPLNLIIYLINTFTIVLFVASVSWFIPFFMYRYYSPDKLISESMVKRKFRYSSPVSISLFIHSILVLVMYLFIRYGYFDIDHKFDKTVTIINLIIIIILLVYTFKYMNTDININEYNIPTSFLMEIDHDPRRKYIKPNNVKYDLNFY
jgi:heme/copper-type cytochrome/quinol oxidase subunit 2